MKWLELTVQASPEFVEPLSEIFYRYGHGGVVVEQAGGYNPDEGEAPPSPSSVSIKTYLPMDATAQDRRNRIDVGVRLIAQLSEGHELRQRVVDEEDWKRAWQEHFHVLRIGRRVVIVPTWRQHDPGPADVVVALDPGMAFGTGHHPTTRMCLELLQELVSPGTSVLDVGCGSGILSIAAAKLGAASVFGLDSDATAVSVAESNVSTNGVSGIVRVAHGTLPRPDVAAGGYDLCLANISRKVVSELANELVAALRPGGEMVVSGILEGDEDSIVERLREAGAQKQRRLEDGDWVALVARRS